MIGSLRGTLARRGPGGVIVDVGGVGYCLQVPATTLLELPQEGSAIELLVNTQVREDSITLYGFRNEAERDVFERLLGVSGVGPRMALAALSSLGPASLVAAIRDGDAKRIASVPGIGRKTAERLIVDLRDRLGGIEDAKAPGPGADHPAGPVEDVVSALVNLGYSDKQARKAVETCAAADEDAGFDELLRTTLARLAR